MSTESDAYMQQKLMELIQGENTFKCVTECPMSLGKLSEEDLFWSKIWLVGTLEGVMSGSSILTYC